MHSGTSREVILKKLSEEWMPEVQELVNSRLSGEYEAFDAQIEQALASIEAGEIEKAFQLLAEKFKAIHPQAESKESGKSEIEFGTEWTRAIREITAAVRTEVQLIQEKERFEPLPEDSFVLQARKFFKKAAFAIHKTVKKPTSSEGSAGGPDGIVWTQNVPLKNILELNLLDLENLLEDWLNETERLRAEILLEASAWILHSTNLIKYEEINTESGENDEETAEEKSVAAERAVSNDHVPNKNDIIVFLNKVQNELQSLHARFLKRLNDELKNIEQEIGVALSLTGTMERSENEYAASVLTRKENQISGNEQVVRRRWNELLNVLIDRMYLNLTFQKLYDQAGERVSGFSESLKEFFEDTIEKQRKELEEMLHEAISVFDEGETLTLKEIRELSSKRREKMKEHVEQNLLKPLQEYLNDATLSTKFDRFTAAIPDWTKTLPEKATLVDKLDISTFPPVYEFEHVDWQILVQRVLNNNLAKEFLPKELKPEQFLVELVQGFQEVSQIIYTNLEIADEVKKSDEEEPFQVAKEGLQRAITKLNELEKQIATKKEELVFKLVGKRDDAFTKLAMLLEKQDVNDLRITGAEYKAKETAVDWKTKLQVYWANIAEKSELFSRFLWKKIKHYFELVRKFLGFAEKEKLEDDKTDLATFLSETDEKIASLPFIYRRLFDFHKEVEERFYIRRTEQFERIKKGYDLWQNNFPSSFAIVGERGSGKSIFIKLLMEEVLKKHDVIEVNFKETIWKPEMAVKKIADALKISDVSDTEELIEAIGRKKKKTVVILENVQKCYLRKISGFEAIEQLMYLISETNKNILWITSSTRYGWLFLDKVMSISEYFTHTVQTDTLSADQIRELILRRHRASGYQLKFLANDAIKKSRSYKKLMDDEDKIQEYLQTQYFEKLAGLAEGNPSIAMIYWIRSIKDFNDTYFNIQPFDFGAISRIDELNSNELFALTAFILHDSLTAIELSKIMHEPLRDSKVMISRLVSRSIISSTEFGFSLNHLIYRHLVRVLKEANFIH